MLLLQATHVHATTWRSFGGARRESWVDAALTRASWRLQKKTATAAPLALSLVGRRGIKKDRGGNDLPPPGLSTTHNEGTGRETKTQISRRRFCGRRRPAARFRLR